MSNAQQRKPKNLIPIPPSLSQAFFAGLIASGTSYVIGVPVEYIPRVVVAGCVYSLYRSFQDSRSQTTPRKPRGRYIPINSHSGQQRIDMELAMGKPGHIARETWGDTLNRWVYGKPKPAARQIEPVSRPSELDEFTFHSAGMQLREKHVRLFLESAWRNRANGKGLSRNHWVRYFDQRPAWYKELSPAWYFAMIDLLYRASDYCNWQLVVEYSNGWRSLVDGDLRLTVCILKWYESEKGKIK